MLFSFLCGYCCCRSTTTYWLLTRLRSLCYSAQCPSSLVVYVALQYYILVYMYSIKCVWNLFQSGRTTSQLVYKVSECDIGLQSKNDCTAAIFRCTLSDQLDVKQKTRENWWEVSLKKPLSGKNHNCAVRNIFFRQIIRCNF